MENGFSPQKILERDKHFMMECLLLAESMAGLTSPRPIVGCVIVKDKKVIGRGVTQEKGIVHAEANALKSVTQDSRGATLYVNLEPCFYNSQGESCVSIISRAGIREVVIGIKDPTIKNHGKGIEALRKAGIRTKVGFAEEECRWINRIFTHWAQTRQPYVIASVGVSKDLKIAERPGVLTQITGEESQNHVHKLRHQCDAIVVGVGTALSDNPQLTDRYSVRRKDPLRIVLDSKLRSLLDASVFADNNVIVATTALADERKMKKFKDAGVEMVVLSHTVNMRVELDALLQYLAQREITSIMVEGGRSVYDSFMNADRIHEWWIFQNKFIIGAQGLDVCSQRNRFEEYINNGKKKQLGDDQLSICVVR